MSSTGAQFAHKLDALATLCGTPVNYHKALVLRRRRRLFNLLPVTRFDCRLWVSVYGSAWRVMVSDDKRSGPFLGADYGLKSQLLETWTWEGKVWTAIKGNQAAAIRHRIEQAVTKAYQQFCQAK